MPAVFPVLEVIHGVGQAGGGLCQVGGVDLCDVTETDDFGALAPRG